MIEASQIEIPIVSYGRVEQAYRYAKKWRDEDKTSWAQIGMRAARARDPKLLRALDQALEVLLAEHERQMGEFQRQGKTDFNERALPSEVGFFREVYRTVDESRPMTEYMWGYAAACWLAGII